MYRTQSINLARAKIRDLARLKNQTIMTLYGDIDDPNAILRLKLVTMKSVKNSLVDSDEIERRRNTNEDKLECNISRARNKIFELSFCNPWQYFFTGTLDGTKYDRTDLDTYHKDFTKWLINQSRTIGNKIDYVLIPELHSDQKTWHMHGLINGLPADQLHQFQIGDRMGKGLANKVRKGDIVYNWSAYQKKFGFCDLEPIKNHEAVSKYITKYISKSLAHSVTDLNAHLYYRSRGLKEALDIKKGTLVTDITSEPISSYESDYCTVEWYDISSFNELIEAFA